MIKKIYTYWDQGFEKAPRLVKECVASWRKHNPDWELLLLDRNSLSGYLDVDEMLPDFAQKNLELAAYSDIVRIALLKKYGGLWVDATVFCMKPLNDWLEEYVTQGFFAFAKPAEDRLLSSWFLYAEKNNYIVEKWYAAVRDYWAQKKEMDTYFWFHYLFNNLYNADERIKSIWESTRVYMADGPHFIQKKGITNELDQETKVQIDSKSIPVYKLSFKEDLTTIKANSIAEYLFYTANQEEKEFGKRYQLKDMLPYIKFIHIGKSGGSYLRTLFAENSIKLHSYHLEKPEYNELYKYILWVRNPIARFVSAFNFAHYLINLDVSHYDPNDLNLENSLAPERIKLKIAQGFTFSEEYDSLVNHFGSANRLAEAITSENNIEREKALRLMSHTEEHIFKGLGWYLDNGEFLRKHRAKILFVGKVETMQTDVEKLSNVLNLNLKPIEKIRENQSEKQSKDMSELAINNIVSFYKDSDYKVLNMLYTYGYMDKATLQSYYTYQGKKATINHFNLLARIKEYLFRLLYK